MADGIPVGKISAGKCLVDDGEIGGVSILSLIPDAALGERNSELLKVCVPHEADVCLLIVDCSQALEIDVRRPTAGGRSARF